MQLNSTQLDVELSWVELRRYRHSHRRNSTVADDQQCNWLSWTARSRSVVFLFPVLHCDVWYTNQRRSFPEKCFLAPLLFLHGRWRLWSICHINRHVFSIILLTLLQILYSKFPSPSKLIKTRHILRHDLQINWVTTLRTDRWQLFTLWRCRQLDVELSWVVSL